MKIQTKVVLSILISGFIALSMALAVTYYHVKTVFTEGIGREFEESARKTAERIDAAVREEITTFQYLAANHAFIEGVRKNRREAIDAYLTYYLSYIKERNEHLDLFVVNNKGMIIAESDLRHGHDRDQSAEQWWKITYSDGRGKVYVSDIYSDKLTGNRAFDIGIPVRDPATGEVVGGIGSILNADLFFDFIKETSFGKTGHSMLMDSEGTPLICLLLPPASHSINKVLMDLIVSRGRGWAISEEDAHGGRGSVVGFSPVVYISSLGAESLGGHQWYTFVRQDPAETFAPVRRIILKIFLMESTIVLILSVIGFFAAHRILIRPVSILREGVERVGNGDLGHRIDIHTGDELEAFADGFNRMGKSLREHYHHLEEKIKERTAELEKAMNYLGNILKYSEDVIITTDLEGRIVTFNEGAERILGYKKEEVIGTFMADYYHHREDREKLLKIIEEGTGVSNYETQLARKDGKIIDISLSLSLLKDEIGKVIGTVGISKDITAWRLAQQQLREYSQRLEAMVEKRTLELEENKSHLEAMLGGIADGVIFTDQENKITFINDAAEAIFGIKRDEWIGKDFKNAHSAEAHQKALYLIEEMRAGKRKSYSSEIKSGDKTISARFSPILHGPEYLGVIFVTRDITEMKRIEAELLQSEKLVLIGKMSSAIAHEIRNPLVPIGGFANLIFKRVEEGSPLKKYAGIIVNEIARLEGLLQNILYFTKDTTPTLGPSSVNEVINEVLFLYNKTFSDKDIELTVRLSQDIPLIQLDPSKMKQALINIFSNAIHAMPDGGTLTIKTSKRDKNDRSYASISIEDTGTGISEEIRGKIFAPFYTTKIQGLGLGLTLTQRIVESHGGEIEVESTEGKGTTFIINLPL